MKPKINHSGGYMIFTFDGLNWREFSIFELIDEIKKTIPAASRSYDLIFCEWSINEKYQDTLNDMFKRYFTDPDQIDMFEEN